jgi:hypothetical protein
VRNLPIDDPRLAMRLMSPWPAPAEELQRRAGVKAHRARSA